MKTLELKSWEAWFTSSQSEFVMIPFHFLMVKRCQSFANMIKNWFCKNVTKTKNSSVILFLKIILTHPNFYIT